MEGAVGEETNILAVLFTADRISSRAAEIGAQLASDYAGKQPLVLGVSPRLVSFCDPSLHCRHLWSPFSPERAGAVPPIRLTGRF